MINRARATLVASLTILGLAVGLVVADAAGTGTVTPPPRIALVAHGVNPADALAAGPIAAQIGAPIFTTSPNALSAGAANGLSAYGPEVVIVVGGAGALPDSILDQVRTATGLTGDDVRRVFGTDRYETARQLSTMLSDEGFTTAFLPVDATAVDSTHLGGTAAADHLTAPVEMVYGSAGWENGNLEGATTLSTFGTTTFTSDDHLGFGARIALDRMVSGGLDRLTALTFCYQSVDPIPIVFIGLIEAARENTNLAGVQSIWSDDTVALVSATPTCHDVDLPDGGVQSDDPLNLLIRIDPDAGGDQIRLRGVYATFEPSAP